MIDLSDLLAGSVDLGLGPSTARGTLRLSLVLSLGVLLTNVWLLLSSDHPLHEPPWGMVAIILGILFGALGAILSAIHLTRHEDEAGLAWASSIVGIASVTVAIANGFMG